MMRRVLKWAARVLSGIAVLAVAAYAYYWYSPAPQVPALSAAIQRATLHVGDRDRTYLAYAPAQLSRGAPLVIVLHGSVMDGAMMRKWTGYELDQWADRKGFVVVYPDGYKHNWNDCHKDATFPAKRENIDDMGFIRALIARMAREHAIDTKRVFVLGYSNGGQMAFRLAIETPDEVAAVAAFGASLPTSDGSSCAQQGRTARVLLANGTLDPINPYEGGKVTIFGFGYRGTALSSRASADQLAQRNGIATAPAATQLPHLHEKDPTSVDSLTWSSGDHTPIAVLYTVHGGGHVVPQPAFRYPRLLGRTAGDLDAPLSALQFFGLSP
jgi:polyhydroxybutyrate depolymerase